MRNHPPPPFSVLTLNLRFGLAKDGPQAWPFRRPVLRRLLSKNICDFMMFQEANDFQIDFIAKCLPDHRVIGHRQPAPPFWQNNVIFYRSPWKLEQWTHFFLSPTPSIPSRFPESRWPRQCTLGRFCGDGYELACGTTHLDFDETVQVASADIILEHTRDLAAHCPVILVGDFNCTPTSACHAAFTSPEKTSGKIPSAFRNVFAPPYPGTFHDFQGGNGGTCIDWILYRGGLASPKAEVIRYRHKGCYPSDHYPVVAAFGGANGLAT